METTRQGLIGSTMAASVLKAANRGHNVSDFGTKTARPPTESKQPALNKPLPLETRQPTVLHDAEIAVILAIFLPACAPQEHPKQQNARIPAP